MSSSSSSSSLSSSSGHPEAPATTAPTIAPVIPGDPLCGKCEDAYKANGSCKKVLLSMCLGLEGLYPAGDDGPASSRKLGDIGIEPYASSKTKNLWKPTTKHLADEVLRRFPILDISKADQFRPKNKESLPVLTDWLNNHPMVDPVDVAFLQCEEKKLFNGLVAAADEAIALAAAHVAGGGNGVIFTFLADLRMVHCLISPGVKEAFLVRHVPMNREQLDARNSPVLPKTWDEELRDKFNDPNFAPHSQIIPSLHSDFAESHDLHRNKCPHNVTAENVKMWVADRKAKLVTLINRWELSGNGDGQRVDTDADFGNVSSNSIQFQEGDNRSSFLRHERSTLLYYWELLVQEDLLQNSVSILPANVAVSSSNPIGDVGDKAFTTPAGRNPKRQYATISNDELDHRDELKRQRNLHALGEVLEKTLGQGTTSTFALDKQAAYNFMSSIHDKLFDLMERVATVDDYQLKQMYKKRIKETKKQLVAAEAAYKKEYEDNKENSPDEDNTSSDDE